MNVGGLRTWNDTTSLFLEGLDCQCTAIQRVDNVYIYVSYTSAL